jgi:ABC-type uncharacterized transport system ATPase subunit
VAVRTASPLAKAQVASLPGVVSCQPQETGWLLGTTDLNRTIIGVVKLLEAGENQLLDLQIQRPSLEDVFIELTGRTWTTPAKEDN